MFNKANLINSREYFEEREDYFIEDLVFDKNKDSLSFIVKKITIKSKITRYVTNNYVKTPIYADESKRIKVIKKFNKIINPDLFLNKQILELEYLTTEMVLSIIEVIGIVPEWRKKQIEIEKLNNKVSELNSNLRDYISEQTPYSYKPTNFNVIPSKQMHGLILVKITEIKNETIKAGLKLIIRI